jgi:hypothetical protein
LRDPSDASIALMTAVEPGHEESDAATGRREICDVAGNCSVAGPIAGNRIDRKPPITSCGSADDMWRASNVSIACTAIDGGSGLGIADDAGFALVTNVADGTEDVAAFTGGRQVCDAVGHCSTAGPVGPFKIDRRPPEVMIVTPDDHAVYLVNRQVIARYSCEDGGSGMVACNGPVTSGGPVDTTVAGSHSFAVVARDAAGNETTRSHSYSVSYDVCLPVGQTVALPAGIPLPVLIRLCDAAGTNLSAAAIAVMATGLQKLPDGPIGPAEDVGNVNPGGRFQYVSLVRSYLFLLDTRGLTPGTYRLLFTAASDPQTHEVRFQVR